MTNSSSPAFSGPQEDGPRRSLQIPVNRWLILIGGVMVQLAIGAVYAWSTFSKAFQSPESRMQLTPLEASIPFETCIAMIFVGSFIGGRVQDRHGPRPVALVGVLLYSLGNMISSFAQEPGQLWLLIVSYGLLGGFGLGLAYIVPIALLQKWFPDRAGIITGIAVGGFGFGAMIASPVAQALIQLDRANPAKPFLILGIFYLVIGLVGAMVFVNPPQGWLPAGMAAQRAKKPAAAVGTRDFTQKEALATPQWYLMTLILTLCVTAGISLVSVAADSAASIAQYDAASAAGLVGIMGLFNGAGRILWAAASDKIGKMPTFAAILGIQGVCLILLPRVGASPAVFAMLAAIIYTCYGGSFGALPSTAGKFFGVSNAGGIYGLMLIGWSIGGVSGPLLTSALLGSGGEKNYLLAYTVIGAIALVGSLIPMVTKPPKPKTVDAEAQAQEPAPA
ncbi:MFS transporter, OFA family, oxalate/formate antiporter [Austwickia chelonae]|uniref:Major facilitator superfamily (MFS) profile domain-containing protein n=1 Tax=Austwickia chelonae NBRC 105200 TaxID=1184607 RepID=K6VRD1_9MICO|nr:OFA family MFS transporter [Austwickia chelonae]GAB77915.1 hypothetical protein AUCHE_08_01580 [Austwickia chelonae NBRC 105200]SEV92153.1 MFS transporter, OFA family, oxalate/formate antiporter [Austwickia chelonae]